MRTFKLCFVNKSLILTLKRKEINIVCNRQALTEEKMISADGQVDT